MLVQKKGFPEESELVLCMVTNVQSHSVFVKIEDYGTSGMIHISEVAPGRIRNIRDYVKEGKMVVCKVLRINKERGHIDLSLRRVTEGQRRNKINDIKQQQKAEKIIEFVAKKLNQDPKEVFTQVSEKLLENYDSVFQGFMDVVETDVTLLKLGVETKLAAELESIIKARLKPERVEVRGNLLLVSEAPDGVERVKTAIKAAKKHKVEAKYIAGGNYLLIAEGPDYKAAEHDLRTASEAAIEEIKKHGGEGSFAEKK